MNNLANHTVKSYDQQLNKLMELILEMGAGVRELVIMAKGAIHARDPQLAEQAKQVDGRINALDHELEQAATIILALQNPLAVDLRFVTSAFKIAGVLERAGDLAKNIVKRSAKLQAPASAESVKRLESMADIVVEMLDEALLAVRERDSKRATAVWKRDDEVDDLYHEFFTAIQREMSEDVGSIASGTHLVFMAKNFERIADYATNLAKTVYYVASGKHADKSLLNSDE